MFNVKVVEIMEKTALFSGNEKLNKIISPRSDEIVTDHSSDTSIDIVSKIFVFFLEPYSI